MTSAASQPARLSRLLVANRGEIAVRILRAAAELGIETVAVHSTDDASSLHVRKADLARPLAGSGAAAYLDIDAIVALARESGCTAIHPGYGFLSENAAFARACERAGIVFVGPRPEVLDVFGDKVRARSLAVSLDVPVLPGSSGATSLDEAAAFLAGLGADGAVMIKAVAGGGGRGMRAVLTPADLPEAYARCRSEAQAAFGIADVYVERLIRHARHIEVQVAGDGATIVQLGERECSIQRRHQKLVEIAPSPCLTAAMRERLVGHALCLAQAVDYSSLGTFEFLVDAADPSSIAFIEANARLQVEHTVTEAVTGIDLVRTQLELAAGRSLDALGLTQDRLPAPRGFAIQVRVNMETLDAQGDVHASAGTLAHFDIPSGPGIRVDTFGYQGYAPSVSFDSLLAKVIAHTPSARFEHAAAKAYQALGEFRIQGVDTNIGFLQSLLRHPDFVSGNVHTRFVEDNIAALGAGATSHRRRYFDGPQAAATVPTAAAVAHPPGTEAVTAPMQARVVSIEVAEGDMVRAGDKVAVLEAMKMEHLLAAGTSGVIRKIATAAGAIAERGQKLLFIEPQDVGAHDLATEESIDLDRIRPDLAEVIRTHAATLDAARPQAVARRRKTGQRTARENIADLCDPDSFVEYGALALAAQRKRRSEQELIDMSPADGVIVGLGSINGDSFGDDKSRCLVLAYDYTVFAGTQGFHGHKKHDRMFQIAEKARLPVVIFAEGGGGRPGESDAPAPVNLANMTFWHFARLSGLAPLVGIVSGRCFAGNAALLGCCDVVIATENATIGMGGPAMIEGGGLGRFAAEEVGPVSVQASNGVVDIVARDEAEAVRLARKYLAFFQGPVASWQCADQRRLRHIIPERRLRAYDVRAVIDTLADTGSVLELRRDFGLGLMTALVRIEGRPLGLIANNPSHQGGAIDSDEADKAARFVELCDAFDLPVLSLCDTPGFMVGPPAEKRAAVRHVCRMFVTGASISVPYFTVVLRKAYGLGAQAMGGGGFHGNNYFSVAWPTGEIGAMGLEGAVQLAYRNELAAIADGAERDARYQSLVADLYERGKATNIARFLSLDDVIDPADTRRWILRGLRAAPPVPPRTGKKRPNVNTW
ncbi:MAG: carboxyl transferase domain-containing protein [Reyranella sp.]|uniref:carboxyl transferase domain-containing protein n=1 Tax=Reyranella sp. TaxID=1929291 RepID=UPI003D0DB3EF